MPVKFADVIYGATYSVTKGFYKDRLGICLAAEKNEEGQPARAKLRVTGTIYNNKPFPPDLVVDVWVDLVDVQEVKRVPA